MVPSGSERNVGSPAPLRRIDSVVPTSHGHEGRQTRSLPAVSVTRHSVRGGYVGGVGDNGAMLLADLVQASRAVGATRSRKAKTAALAEALALAEPEEVETATSYLSGVLRQRRTGLGWRSLADLPEPAGDQHAHRRGGARGVRGAQRRWPAPGRRRAAPS